mmetsp:Transcript_28647/g.69552  ORF Transcript_28647/g.69552 Transcript_28647/m.69552 type:complete len:82 (+) Transcript_28647:358-603(+)
MHCLYSTACLETDGLMGPIFSPSDPNYTALLELFSWTNNDVLEVHVRCLCDLYQLLFYSSLKEEEWKWGVNRKEYINMKEQ